MVATDTTTPRLVGGPIENRILVVDDERVVTDVVERYLRLEGYDVALASNGAEALQLAQESIAGKGSTFSFTLPKRPAQRAAPGQVG